MTEIKSAFEKAMEKAEKLGEASEEELKKWKYVPEGEKLAARYLRDEGNLIVELSRYDEDIRQYISDGARETLIRNIDLPRSDFVKRSNRRAMEGIKALKHDKASVENVYSKIRRIFNHYQQEGEQQRSQAYQALKADFEARLQQSLQQQIGTSAPIKLDVERQPRFQEEWRRTLAQLDSQYYKLLEEYKQELRSIP